jgi:hypothetical protein
VIVQRLQRTGPTRRATIAVVATAWALSACTGIQGGTEPDSADRTVATGASDDRFCEAMSHLVVLLEPGGSPSPDETRATFDEAALWFAQAGDTAPGSIRSDVTAYVAAYDDYIEFLGTVGYRLDDVFSTPEGLDLANDTSHTFTPAILRYVTDDCGLHRLLDQ